MKASYRSCVTTCSIVIVIPGFVDFAFHQRRLDKQTCSSKLQSPSPFHQAFPQLSSQRAHLFTTQQETSNDPKLCTTRALRHQASNFNQRYATMMIKYDYLSWIVFLSHSCGVHQSDQQQEQILHLIRTEGLKATVSVCTPCNDVLSLCRQQV